MVGIKIAVSAMGSDPEAFVAPYFARCACFVVYDSVNKLYSIMKVSSRRRVSAGIHTARSVVGGNVEAIITGNIGPHALRVLREAGVRCYFKMTGTVRDCLKAYENGDLEEIEAATVPPYNGVDKDGLGDSFI